MFFKISSIKHIFFCLIAVLNLCIRKASKNIDFFYIKQQISSYHLKFSCFYFFLTHSLIKISAMSTPTATPTITTLTILMAWLRISQIPFGLVTNSSFGELKTIVKGETRPVAKARNRPSMWLHERRHIPWRAWLVMRIPSFMCKH